MTEAQFIVLLGIVVFLIPALIQGTTVLGALAALGLGIVMAHTSVLFGNAVADTIKMFKYRNISIMREI